MTVRNVRRLLMIGLLSACLAQVEALEFVVTDTVGGYNTPLNTTTNKLNLGDNPVPKTVYVYIKYSQAEANTINDTAGTGSTTPGLYGGSFQFAYGTANIVAVKTSGDITRGPAGSTLNWDTFTPNVPPTTATVRATFNQGLTAPALVVADPGAGNFGYYVIGQVLISPATINPTGSTITVSRLAGASWQSINKAGGAVALGVPTTFTFTVVPEPSSIALSIFSAFALAGTAIQRRKRTNFSGSR